MNSEKSRKKLKIPIKSFELSKEAIKEYIEMVNNSDQTNEAD